MVTDAAVTAVVVVVSVAFVVVVVVADAVVGNVSTILTFI